MAKLGSSIDARLSRISPYATSAILQGGASMGAGYSAVGAGLGKAITSIMHQTEERRIDEILNEALMPQEGEMRNVGDDRLEGAEVSPGYQPYTPVLDSEGKPTSYSQLDEKAIRRFLSDKKVFGRNISEKRIASFLKQERDSIDANNTTQLAVDTYEANKKETEANQLFRQSQADLALSRHQELMAKEEQRYELELKRYNEVIADRAATKAEKTLAAEKKLEAEQKRKTNRGILGTIAAQMDQKDDFGNPLLSAEDYLNLADQMEKMVLKGEIIDTGLITFAGSKIIEGTRIGQSMQSLAEADDAGADANESREVRLETAKNKMVPLLQYLPESDRARYESLSPSNQDDWLRTQLEGFKKLRDQGKPPEPGSGEEAVSGAISEYLSILDEEYGRFGDVKDTYETPEEKRRRQAEETAGALWSPYYGTGIAY